MTKSKIGFVASISFVMGNMIGSGVFLIPASLALYGWVSLWGWGAAAFISGLLAIIYGKLAQWHPQAAGGPYGYTRLVFGEFPAFLVAWGYWVSIWCTNAAIVVALTGYLTVFFPFIGRSSIYSAGTALLFVWGFTAINSRSIATLGIIQFITLILKIIPILFIALAGILYADFDLVFSPNKSGLTFWGAVTSATTITFFAFLGLESATIPGEDTENPAQTIKSATIWGTLLTTIVYILSSVAVMGILLPERLALSSAPFAEAAQTFLGSTAKYLVAGGAVFSTIGALNGWIFVQGRVPLAAARDHLFPQIFGKSNRFGSPSWGIVVSSVLISLLVMANYSKTLVEAFTFMMKLSTLSVITTYLFSVLAFVKTFHSLGYKERAWFWSVALMSIAGLVWVTIGCGVEIILLGLLLLAAGIPFYLWMKKV